MKDCLVCGHSAPATAHTCASCGSADWSAVKPAAPAQPPAGEPALSSRDKRNKV